MASSDEGQKFRARLCVDLDQTTGLSETFGCKNIFGNLSNYTLRIFGAARVEETSGQVWCTKCHNLPGLGLQFFLAHE